MFVFSQVKAPRKFLIPAEKHDVGAKVTNMGNLSKAITLIRNKLGHAGIKAFRKTCFGHFLKTKPLTFSSAMVHSLLLRQIECDDPHVLEFNFHGVGVRFDRMAFTLVTGLKCTKFPADQETRDLKDTLWDKYFGSGPLTLKEFIERFEQLTFNTKHIKDNVKACMFYLVEAVLLGGEKRRFVNKDNFRIIQNEALCNTYPWGTVSYMATIASLRSAVNRNNLSKTYTLYGFPLAFQVFFIVLSIFQFMLIY